MDDKPQYASEYGALQTEMVRSTCLYVATKLGDLMDDAVIVGGLVPSLLVDQRALPEETLAHVGTMDLDLGLNLALFHEERYREFSARLREADFKNDKNKRGNQTRQRWEIRQESKVAVDFLIPPSVEEDRGGSIRNLEHDFAAVITPGLELAFRDRERVSLEGRTLLGEKANRDVWICGPGAFILMKALAFKNRGQNKDAYDLFYVLQNYGTNVDDVFYRLSPLLEHDEAQRAIEILRRDFTDPEGPGPIRVAKFLTHGRDEDIQADVVGFVNELLARCR